MAHTHNQDFDRCITTLDKGNEKTKKQISNLNSNIASINFRLHQLDIINAWLTDLEELPTAMKKLTTMFTQSQDPLSFSPPYNLEDTKSSHSTPFHFNHFQHEMCLPIFKVNKFDSSNPIG
jgi:hypothetical protein